MNTLEIKEFYSIVAGGSVLCFNAGFINVVSMAGAYGATVSHVTGNITRIGIAIFQEDLTVFALVSSITFSFLLGSFVAGFIVGDSRFNLGRSYGYALLLESFILFISFIFSSNELVIGQWLAAFACGLQNAIATTYSGFTVRTTHLTGMVTDVGNLLGQACRSDATFKELWRLKVFIPLLVSYLFGAVSGKICYSFVGDKSLLFPSMLVGSLGSIYLMTPFVQEAKKLLKAGRVPKAEVISSPFKAKIPPTPMENKKSVPVIEQIEIRNSEYINGMERHGSAEYVPLEARKLKAKFNRGYHAF